MTSPARLAILASLFPGIVLPFSELKRRSGLADGNLHVQTRKLASAGYLEIVKSKRGGRSLTRFRITELGKESLRLHIRRLQAILATESAPLRPTPRPAAPDGSQVWSHSRGGSA